MFDELAGHPDSWPQWLTPARDCRYEGNPPYGVGTMRRLTLRGGILARERVLAWDEPKRFAYRIEQTNLPGVRAFMEEWSVEPVAEGSTRVRWVLAADCARPVRLLLQAGRTRIDRVFQEGTRRMAAL